MKENELQYLKKEVQCLREELQMMQKVGASLGLLAGAAYCISLLQQSRGTRRQHSGCRFQTGSFGCSGQTLVSCVLLVPAFLLSDTASLQYSIT